MYKRTRTFVDVFYTYICLVYIYIYIQTLLTYYFIRRHHYLFVMLTSGCFEYIISLIGRPSGEHQVDAWSPLGSSADKII